MRHGDFRVTGDLARKKVMPAIYDLANRGLLPLLSRWSGSPAATGITRISVR
ncbi:glucose-6-phosphate dehydrogenase, NAD binding domain protein [Mycobacterium xenopi 4042]|uniref:Glucose-6-phosphate dehydrogenase, NAD binding domain protein n=1 Tax=Mycobacterium xenopi 4042 TaxID=1299334 RepID=X7YQB1_MYCXE|nr:glucose-6-phosphate dehydrogenase, NAD binding domain protein [Mycobacterium xenopi 4042]